MINSLNYQYTETIYPRDLPKTKEDVDTDNLTRMPYL